MVGCVLMDEDGGQTVMCLDEYHSANPTHNLDFNAGLDP
jgi:hypothetical protein